MAFGSDDLVEISYQANVTGLSEVQALATANGEVQATTDQYTKKVKESTIAHEKHKNVLLQTHQAVRQLHRELFAGVFIFATVTAGLRAMAAGSESAQMGLDQLTQSATKALGALGNWAARGVAYWGAIAGGASPDEALKIANEQTNSAKSLDTKIKLANMEAQLLKTQGDDLAALKAKQNAENLALEKEAANKSYDQFKAALNRQHQAELDAYHLSELGLESHIKIMNNLQKDLVSGFQSDTGNVIANLISGRKQSGDDILQSFRDTLGKSFGDAISKTLFTTMFSGGGLGDFFSNFKNILTGNTPALIAAKNTADNTTVIKNQNDEMLAVLRQIAECTCSTAQSANQTMTATINPAKVSTLSKVGSVLGLVGAVGSLGNLGGGSLGPPEPGPTFTYGPNPKLSSGGFVMRSFATGGEVPAMVMPGEFVVRRPAAMANKNLLQQINAGGKPQAGTNGSVYVINANDAASFSQMLSSPSARAQLEIQIIRAIANNGSLRDIIRTYGR